MQITYRLDNIEQAVAQFWELAKDYNCFVFNGDLGAGKTTFTVALCKFLGVRDVPSSPTFSIINEYHYNNPSGATGIIYHSDWYRLKSEEEAIDAGIEDMLQQKNALCIVEWAERAPGLLNSPYVEVDFTILSEQERTLIVNFR